MRFIGLVLVLLSLTCNAADVNSKFAVKGAGRKSCEDFVRVMDSKTNDYYVYGGWLEGYISGYNQSQVDNYDIAPWQSTELMLSLIKHQCKTNKEMPFLTATNMLIKTLFPVRLKQADSLVRIDFNDHHSYYYQSTLINAKQRLKKLGFISYEIDDSFEDRDASAFSEYQKKAGLRVTGVPDQVTLSTLFLKSRKK
ncbi:peptidoglycan-binding domain-containing protein [Vibrio sp. HN007]|uniref:peptidoglycan-binding domain-containing protein n=1 Tax=Vibrio iocasae TaxID=3098914 RepID=UPI0035D48A44